MLEQMDIHIAIILSSLLDVLKAWWTC